MSARRCFPDIRLCGGVGLREARRLPASFGRTRDPPAPQRCGKARCGQRCRTAGSALRVPSFPRSAVRVSLRRHYSAPGSGSVTFNK